MVHLIGTVCIHDTVGFTQCTSVWFIDENRQISVCENGVISVCKTVVSNQQHVYSWMFMLEVALCVDCQGKSKSHCDFRLFS